MRKKLTALVIVFLFFFSIIPILPTIPLTADEVDRVLVSDCSTLNGWVKTSGNALYVSQNGWSSSNAIQCDVNMGLFKTCTYTLPTAVDIRGQNRFEWDMFFNPGIMWDQIQDQYSYDIYLKLGSSATDTRTYRLDKITSTQYEGSPYWYKLSVDLDYYSEYTGYFDYSSFRYFEFVTKNGGPSSNVSNGTLRFDNMYAVEYDDIPIPDRMLITDCEPKNDSTTQDYCGTWSRLPTGSAASLQNDLVMGTGYAITADLTAGTLRDISYTLASPVDVSSFLRIEWDMRAFQTLSPDTDAWEDIVAKYGSTIGVKLVSVGGGSISFSLDKLIAVPDEDKPTCYRVWVDLSDYTSMQGSFNMTALKEFHFYTNPLGPVVGNINSVIRLDNLFMAKGDITVEPPHEVFEWTIGSSYSQVNPNNFAYTVQSFQIDASSAPSNKLMLTMSFYVENLTNPGNIRGFTRNNADGQIELTSSGASDSQEYNWSLPNQQLKAGWNYLRLPLRDANIAGGGLNIASINYFRLYNLVPLGNTDIFDVRIKDIKLTNEPTGKPYAVDVTYDDGMGVCVALYDVVKDFGANADGVTDDSPAIQRALRAAKNKGGGVVYIPEGTYLCETPILLPSGVTLRGEWVSPETAAPGSLGTVLLATGNRGCETASALFTMNEGAGLRNLTILYPDQLAGNIAAYPPTIKEVPDGESYNVMNMTIAGAWIGYHGWTGLSELHYLKNVYITAFKNAIMLDTVTDIGRLEGVHLGPDYLLENTLYPFTAEQQQVIRSYMFNNSIGLYMRRSDWEYVYDFSAEGLESGILAEQNSENKAPNAQFMKLEFTNCKVAIDVAATNGNGCAFTDVVITGNATCDAGVLLRPTFTETCQFDNLQITGPIKEQISYKGTGRITMVNSSFAGWDTVNRYAVNIYSGGISLQQCAFNGSSKHVTVSDQSGAVSVLGCTFSGQPNITYNSSRTTYVKINHTALNLPVRSAQHLYRSSIPKPSSLYLYDVTDYGAVPGADSTVAFSQALAAAGVTGGTVYVPAGEYTISSSLTVPTGVELRGIYDVATHPKTQGSVLFTTLGQGSEIGNALIKLQAGSGINGISFYYPQQSFTNFIPYPWTVQSQGQDCWAINTVFINSYNALDFATNPSDGHYIQYVSGSPIRRGVFAGNNNSNGWMENVHFNAHYWKRSTVSVIPSAGMDQYNGMLNTSLDGIILGDNVSEHLLGTFVFSAKNAMLMKSQVGQGTSGTIIGHGSDGCRNGLVIEQANNVKLVNSELVAMNYDGTRSHVVMEQTVTGRVEMFNSMMWAQPTTSIVVRGGTLVISQLHYFDMTTTQYLVEVIGGRLEMNTALLLPKTVQIKLSTGAQAKCVANLIKPNPSVPPAGGPVIAVQNNGGSYTPISTWWA